MSKKYRVKTCMTRSRIQNLSKLININLRLLIQYLQPNFHLSNYYKRLESNFDIKNFSKLLHSWKMILTDPTLIKAIRFSIQTHKRLPGSYLHCFDNQKLTNVISGTSFALWDFPFPNCLLFPSSKTGFHWEECHLITWSCKSSKKITLSSFHLYRKDLLEKY